MSEPLVNNLKEYAERWRMDTRTLKKLMLHYDIPHIKLDRKILFPVASADEALKRIAEEQSAKAR